MLAGPVLPVRGLHDALFLNGSSIPKIHVVCRPLRLQLHDYNTALQPSHIKMPSQNSYWRNPYGPWRCPSRASRHRSAVQCLLSFLSGLEVHGPENLWMCGNVWFGCRGQISFGVHCFEVWRCLCPVIYLRAQQQPSIFQEYKFTHRQNGDYKRPEQGFGYPVCGECKLE
jgi:hypothetical protein